MTTKTRPTPKKLPLARVFVADYDARYPAEVRFETYETVADQHDNRPDLQPFHVAFIPTHTAAQAKRIVAMAPFLQMSAEEQVEKLHAAIAADPDYQSIAHHQWLDLAGTVLRCMGLGGRGGK